MSCHVTQSHVMLSRNPMSCHVTTAQSHENNTLTTMSTTEQPRPCCSAQPACLVSTSVEAKHCLTRAKPCMKLACELIAPYGPAGSIAWDYTFKQQSLLSRVLVRTCHNMDVRSLLSWPSLCRDVDSSPTHKPSASFDCLNRIDFAQQA